jgi:hypothetical protein
LAGNIHAPILTKKKATTTTKDSFTEGKKRSKNRGNVKTLFLNIVLVRKKGKENTIIAGCSHFSRMIAFLRFSNKAICNQHIELHLASDISHYVRVRFTSIRLLFLIIPSDGVQYKLKNFS